MRVCIDQKMGLYFSVAVPDLGQVLDTERALRRAQSGGREDSQHSQENGAQDLLRRSLPEGTAFSR